MVSIRNSQRQTFALLVSSVAMLSALSLSSPCSAQSPQDSAPSGNSYYYSGSALGEPLEAIPAVAELQPREEERQPERAPAPRQPRTSRSGDRLSSVPQMFGDFFANGGQFLVDAQFTGGPQLVFADVPTAGGSRRVKIGENNKPYTDDRVYFMYNHFHNALQVRGPVVDFETQQITGFAGPARQFPVDRYTFGIEKSFFDGSCSAELRMPFSSTYEFTDDQPGSHFDIRGGKVGNLAVILKALLLASDTSAVAAGLGIDLPTGSDVNGRFANTNFAVQNQAYHLLPFVGLLCSPNDVFFFNGFAQLDLAANGNAIDVQDMFNPAASGRLGKYTEQNLLYLDASGGVWLYRNPDAVRFTGLAGIAELHYTTTMQDTDIVPLQQQQQLMTNSGFQNFSNRQDILNVTAGLHAELGDDSNVRVAVVVPVRRNNDRVFGPTDRFFDSELQVQFNRRY
jgi:hypothetical protein